METNSNGKTLDLPSEWRSMITTSIAGFSPAMISTSRERSDRWLYFAVVSFILCVTNVAAAQPKHRPKFSDYPAQSVYKGRPANPVLNQDQRSYRTTIREAAKAKVQFAGHYTMAAAGCGAGCTLFYVVDSISGHVYDGWVITELPLEWQQENNWRENDRMEFHPNSRLLKINACPGETDCGFYDYEMVEGVGLKLLHKELLPPKYQ